MIFIDKFNELHINGDEYDKLGSFFYIMITTEDDSFLLYKKIENKKNKSSTTISNEESWFFFREIKIPDLRVVLKKNCMIKILLLI